MEPITTIKQLIDLWPARRVLAEELATTKDRVDKWAQSGSIPARFHGPLLRAAARRGFSVTADDMVRLHDGPEGEAA
jgi:hypothetical protein